MDTSVFRDAVAKGLGRAIVALRTGEIAPSKSLMRVLVLRWQGYDAQCEENRGAYCADLIESSGHSDELSTCVYRLLGNNKGYWAHSRQRAGTAIALFQRGDEKARAALYSALDLNDSDYRLGDEIIQLDGLAAFPWVLEKTRDSLPPSESLQVLIWKQVAEERDGEERVQQWLSDPNNHSVAAIIEAALKRQASNGPPLPRPVYSFEEFKQSEDARMISISWVRRASKEDLSKAAADFLVSEDPVWLNTLGNALRKKADICDVDALLNRARDWKNSHQNPFVKVLKDIRDERVRDEGLRWLDSDVPGAFSLLSKNARLGDELAMYSGLVSSVEASEVDPHGIGLDIVKAAHETEIDASELLKWTYENTPCSLCRNSAVRELIKRSTISDEMLLECLWDADPDTRMMAKAAQAGC